MSVETGIGGGAAVSSSPLLVNDAPRAKGNTDLCKYLARALCFIANRPAPSAIGQQPRRSPRSSWAGLNPLLSLRTPDLGESEQFSIISIPRTRAPRPSSVRHSANPTALSAVFGFDLCIHSADIPSSKAGVCARSKEETGLSVRSWTDSVLRTARES